MFGRCRHGAAREEQQIICLQVFLADLDPIHTCSDNLPDAILQAYYPVLTGCSCETLTIGHVAKRRPVAFEEWPLR
jgi:hypothetical protein